jgi:phosphohistidine swiveling domain-containing protein
MASRIIKPIESLSPRRAAEFGGKVRGLALLSRAGFPVPKAVALSVRAAEEHFQRVLDDDSQPEVLLVTGEYDAESLAAIRERVTQAPLEASLEMELELAVGELLADGGGLAVRSSATLEDTEDYSAAGLHETVLGLTSASDVSRAIRAIWSSLFEPRVLTYLRAQRRDAPPKMGVILQKLVEPRAAGVFFTVNPLTGDAGEVVIDASYGFGTVVVGGRVGPDTVRLDKATRMPRDRIIGDKRLEDVLDGGALVERPVDAERAARLCLAEPEIERLLELALSLEEKFKEPLDVEFAVHEGGIELLQMRPCRVTVQPGTRRWSKRVGAAVPDRRDYFWSNVNVGEALPGVATPLTWSVLSGFSELGFRRAFGAIGCSVPKDAELVGDFRGRIYLNLTEFMSILSQIPGMRPSAVLALAGEGVNLELLERGIVKRSSRAFFSRLPFAIRRFMRENYRIERRLREFDEVFSLERGRISALDLRVLSPAALDQTLLDVEDLLDDTGAMALNVYGNLLATLVVLYGLLKLTARDEADPLLRDLLVGLTDVESAEPGYALAEIAARARREEAVERFLTDQTTSMSTFEGFPEGPTRRALEEFLERFGHRGPREAELSERRWSEDPSFVLAALRASLVSARAGTAPRDPALIRASIRREAEARLARTVPLPLRGAVKTLVSMAQRFMMLRESLRSDITLVLGMIRAVALEVSRRIETWEPEAGPDAAFFLTLDEIHAGLRASLTGISLRIQQRRAALVRDEALPDPPDSFVGLPPPVVEERYDDDRIRGVGASAGVAEGRVLKLERPEDAALAQPGDVLVSVSADVGFSPLFLVASAVVVDRGGPLSHASIVLREFGVPAVVNAKNATSRLRTGQRVRVDGASGIVTILHEN